MMTGLADQRRLNDWIMVFDARPLIMHVKPSWEL